MQECIVLNVLGPAILIQSWSALFLFLFQPKLSLFCKSPGFSPRWGPLSLSPSQFVQLCCAHCGDPGEVSAPGQLSSDHQAAQNLFSGAFQNSNPNFHFYCLPHQHISIFKNQAPSKVKCHRTAFCRDQTVTERPVRPRVSAPAIVEILTYVFMCHTPVTLIKSTYLLTYLLGPP